MKTTILPTDWKDTIYDFEHVGEVFPEHSHMIEDNHLTIVARGGIEVFGGTKFNGDVYGPGAVIVWDAPKSHGFKALTDSTRIVQISQRRGTNGGESPR